MAVKEKIQNVGTSKPDPKPKTTPPMPVHQPEIPETPKEPGPKSPPMPVYPPEPAPESK